MAEEDIVFGKNRHFFGGVEPSNLKKFTVTEANDLDLYDRITITLPDDTVVNGQTVCTVAGAVIRYSNDHYPTNEFDGTFVADVKNSGVIACPVESTYDIYVARYYAAFPYTTQGVYNRNKANRCSAHEPAALKSMSAIPKYDSDGNLCVELNWVFGDDILGTYGIDIYRSTVGYLDSNSTKEVSDKKAVQVFYSDRHDNYNVRSYTDTNDIIIGQTYFYTAFPSYQGAGPIWYNFTSNVGRVSCIPADNAGGERTYFFGYDLDLSDENPATRVSYPADVDNAGYNAAGPDDTSTSEGGPHFTYGDWNIAPGEKFMPRPCVLGFDGVVKYYLNPNDYTKKEDGSLSNINTYTLDGNVMVEWPKIYTKRWEENGVYHFRCSDVQLNSSYDCWCNYDKNDNVIDHFYTAVYLGYKDANNRIRSISGVSPYNNDTEEKYVTYAKNNGADWYTDVVADRLLIQDLLVMMGKSTDSQHVFGYGVTSKSSSVASGSGDHYGMFGNGNSYSQQDIIKVFGMEHFWGNLYRYCSGYVFDTGSGSTTTPYDVLLKITRGRHDGSTIDDYTNTGEGYLKGRPLTDTELNALKSKVATQPGSRSGYISELHTTPYGRIFDVHAAIVTNSSASSSKYYPDEFDCFMDSPGSTAYNYGRVTAYVGGRYNSSTGAGPFCVFFDPASIERTTCGVALSCKPSAN